MVQYSVRVHARSRKYHSQFSVELPGTTAVDGSVDIPRGLAEYERLKIHLVRDIGYKSSRRALGRAGPGLGIVIGRRPNHSAAMRSI